MEEKNQELPLCLCGCGERVTKPRNKYLHGHAKPKKGYKLSEETKKKMSESKKGIPQPEVSERMTKWNLEKWKDPEMREKWSASKRGERHPMYGKKHTEEAKQKMSESHIGVAKPSVSEWISQRNRELWADPILRLKFPSAHFGEKHPKWNGGTSCEPYCELWQSKEYKEEIKERDNDECQNPFCWGNDTKLCIHHINYNKLDCHPNNLITVCISCNSRANSNREYWQALYESIIENKTNKERNTYAFFN